MKRIFELIQHIIEDVIANDEYCHVWELYKDYPEDSVLHQFAELEELVLGTEEIRAIMEEVLDEQ